jgi:hypothetical protein
VQVKRNGEKLQMREKKSLFTITLQFLTQTLGLGILALLGVTVLTSSSTAEALPRTICTTQLRSYQGTMRATGRCRLPVGRSISKMEVKARIPLLKSKESILIFCIVTPMVVTLYICRMDKALPTALEVIRTIKLLPDLKY